MYPKPLLRKGAYGATFRVLYGTLGPMGSAQSPNTPRSTANQTCWTEVLDSIFKCPRQKAMGKALNLTLTISNVTAT
jgi:hypothetical protein